jgi:hypothetical protein
MAEPPFETGAVQLIVAEETPAIPVTPRTADGGPIIGVTADEGEEIAEVSSAVIAKTVNVSGVPVVRLLMVAVRTLPTVTELPEDDVTVYPVISEPETGAIHETVAEPLPATAEMPVGGGDFVVKELDDAADPHVFTEVIVTV